VELATPGGGGQRVVAGRRGDEERARGTLGGGGRPVGAGRRGDEERVRGRIG